MAVPDHAPQAVGAALPDWRAARRPLPTRLTGRYVGLEPVVPDRHAPDLHAAYQQATDIPLWTYMSIGPFDTAAAYHAYLQQIATSCDPLHFVIVDGESGKPSGTFALMRVDPPNGVIEIGFIVYSPLLRRTRAATEALFLLLRHVFDDLGYRRVEWKCNALNAPSRVAALRYGFTFEGIFRQARVERGRNRDTAWFSIIDAEWPALRECYERWLSPENFDTTGKQRQALATHRAGAAA